ncbi:hypothetical protein Mh1956_20840 [Mannheimia haemolytica]
MYKHILVAVDLSEESLVLVRKGAALAEKCGAKLPSFTLMLIFRISIQD